MEQQKDQWQWSNNQAVELNDNRAQQRQSSKPQKLCDSSTATELKVNQVKELNDNRALLFDNNRVAKLNG